MKLSNQSQKHQLEAFQSLDVTEKDDLGNTWEQTSTAMAVTVRPFYFSHMVVDPVDFDRVYKPGLFFAYSTDAGESFAMGGSMHSDLHAVWIDPENTAEILVGTDGALDETFGSTCHGAGRVLSRHAAKKRARGQDIIGRLAEKGIMIRAAGRATVAEEIPEAYKDVRDVVDVVDRAGIGRKVVQLKPACVIKG